MTPDTEKNTHTLAPNIAEILREKTSEERLKSREEFFKMVRESTDEEDEAIDELFRLIRRNRQIENWSHSEAEEEIA